MSKKVAQKDLVWERRKNAILRSYHKSFKRKDGFNQIDNKNFVEGDRKSFFKRAMEEYEFRRSAKERFKKLKEIKMKEKEAALKKYAEKKKQNFKKISKKTKYGQPVMSGRMEILLEKIQKSYAADAIKSDLDAE